MSFFPQRNWWEDIDDRNLQLLFGDESQLTQHVLRRGIDHAQEVLLQLSEIRDHKKLTPFVRECSGYSPDDTNSVLDGWIAIYRALAMMATNKNEITQIAGLPEQERNADVWKHLKQFCLQAISAFDQVWGDTQSTTEHFAEEWLGRTVSDENLWRSMFREIGRDDASAGFWIVWNTLTDLAEQKPKPVSVRSACTPVAIVKENYGHILWLTVELLPGQSPGFDPDPLSLGLTAIQASQPDDFAASMRNVWRKADVNRLMNVPTTFRGRWRINSRCPLPNHALPGDGDVYLPRLQGRSAEAAALACLWAAAGYVPYKSPYESDRPFPLLPDALISAKLGDSVPDQELTEIPLHQVGGLRAKIEAAQRAGMLTMLLAADEPRLDDEPAEPQPTSARPLSQGDLVIHRPTTIGKALHHMLTRSQLLSGWQQSKQHEWFYGKNAGPDSKPRWQEGTADFAAMAVAEDETAEQDS